MEVIDVIALLSLCIACIKLGMDINKNRKNNRPSPKVRGYFLT